MALPLFDLITIYSIIHKKGSGIYARSIKRLIDEGIIIRHPKYEFVMGDSYFKHSQLVLKGLVDAETLRRLYNILEDGPKSMSAFINEWKDELTVKQVRNKIDKLVGSVLIKTGMGRGTSYELRQ